MLVTAVVKRRAKDPRPAPWRVINKHKRRCRQGRRSLTLAKAKSMMQLEKILFQYAVYADRLGRLDRHDHKFRKEIVAFLEDLQERCS